MKAGNEPAVAQQRTGGRAVEGEEADGEAAAGVDHWLGISLSSSQRQWVGSYPPHGSPVPSSSVCQPTPSYASTMYQRRPPSVSCRQPLTRTSSHLLGMTSVHLCHVVLSAMCGPSRCDGVDVRCTEAYGRVKRRSG